MGFSAKVCAEEKQTPPQEVISSSTDARIMKLEDCLATALRQNTDILRAREEIRRANGVKVEVTAAALPKVTASAGGAREKQELANGISPFPLNQTYWTSGVKITQLIYAGGSVAAAMDMAELTHQNAFAELNKTIDRIIFAAKKDFYDVLLQRSMIQTQEESVKLLEEELDHQRKRFEAGTTTKFNVLRAEVELANARPKLIRARNNYRLAQVELAQLLAMDYGDMGRQEPPFEVVGELSFNPTQYSLEEAVETAVSSRPELQAALRQIEIQKKEVDVSDAGYLPRISAFGGYDERSDRTSSNLKEETGGWSVGVQGSWDIFDGFLTKGKTDQAQAKLATSVLTAEETRRNVDLETRQAFFKWQEAQELIVSQQKNVEQATESLRLARARFDAGVGTQLDVLAAQTALTEAKTNELQARYDYNLAVADLERATAAPIKISHES
ncbi:MAG: TolC family protein [bacterium]